jgi:hypothetical protein
MIDYTLKIDSPDVLREVNGFNDVITRLIWTMTGTDGDLTASTSASTDLPAPTEGEPFTAFADLTDPAILIGWVMEHTDACRGEGYLDSRKAIIAAEIEALRDPYVPPKAPWVPEPEPEAPAEPAPAD